MKTSLISVKEAQELIKGASRVLPSEIIPISNAFGRILAEDILADRNYPPFNRSAVDGFAINCKDLNKLKEFVIIEEVHAGSVASKILTLGTAIKIMTGAPVPSEANCVIKVEDATISGNVVRFKMAEGKEWMNIAKEGEDLAKDQIAIPSNTNINAISMGILSALGKSSVKVYKSPTIAIVSTGNEIKPIDENILPHHIRDSNSYSLEGFFKSNCIDVTTKKIVPDNKEELETALVGLLKNDITILSGGVSMGDADFVPEVLNKLGVKKLFHKIAIKPGKPIWFGVTLENKVVFALPGNPFSCQVAFKIFIEPYLRKCFGLPPLKTLSLPIRGIKKKKTDFDDYFPCLLEDSHVVPVRFNGSGDICSILKSEGIALHPGDKGELKEGELVEFMFW